MLTCVKKYCGDIFAILCIYPGAISCPIEIHCKCNNVPVNALFVYFYKLRDEFKFCGNRHHVTDNSY